MIPVSAVSLGPEVEASVVEVIRSGMLAQGPKVAELERRFAELTGARHVVAVNNGTTSLIAAMSVLDLQPGDEVVTSPFTFVATLNAILAAGATARFADISLTDFNLDPAAVEGLVGDRTRVLMPVHLYGQCADMPALSALAERHGLAIVEDAAQAHGATVAGRGAGTWGIGSFSLYATKNLTSGEGGLITTGSDELADRLRLLRNQGMRERYRYEMAGNNYRMTDLQAAVCLPQLDTYAANVERRRANAASLSTGLGDVTGLVLPTTLADRAHVWHQYTVLVTDEAPVTRDQLSDALAERGVGSGIYYPRLVHDYDCYRDDDRVVVDPTPNADLAARQCLSLPVHPGLSPADLDTIVSTVRDVMGAR
jgi:dTDP-4-amino-4,6-dideoxygalactose transaminase